MSEFSLHDLAALIEKRAADGDAKSYTGLLLNSGTQRCARKFGEEAIELIIAAMGKDREQIKLECADVLYHLLVLLKACNVDFSTVVAELGRRTGKSGLEEKASRPKV